MRLLNTDRDTDYLLTEIISTSNQVSCNNNIGLREGQHLPLAHKLLFNDDRWDPYKEIDWELIKNIWHKYWDRSKDILLEKRPPNICRAEKIDKVFQDSKYLRIYNDMKILNYNSLITNEILSFI